MQTGITIFTLTAALTASAVFAADPAWRPETRSDLVDLVTCDALLRAEIQGFDKKLAFGGAWTGSHQTMWRLGAERDLIVTVSRIVMDQGAREAVAAANPVAERDPLDHDETRRALKRCTALAHRIHAMGDENGGRLRPLPRSRVFASPIIGSAD